MRIRVEENRGGKLKVSIVVPILNSHEIVRRQIEYFKSLNLPDDIEIIFMDDGSEPPLTFPDCGLKTFGIYATNDKRPWTENLARNKGAWIGQGEYLLMTDIDHILSREAIEAVYKFQGDKMTFPRFFAILDENGRLVQDDIVLLAFGLNKDWYDKHGLYAGHHGNTFAMRKVVFHELGGYDVARCERPWHAGEDRAFNRVWRRAEAAGKCKPSVEGPPIFMFPVGRFCGDGTDIDFNPKGLFNDLKRVEVPQPMIG